MARKDLPNPRPVGQIASILPAQVAAAFQPDADGGASLATLRIAVQLGEFRDGRWIQHRQDGVSLARKDIPQDLALLLEDLASRAVDRYARDQGFDDE